MSLVLITRPHPDADSLAAGVAERGWTPLVEPLLEIAWRDDSLPPLDAFQAVLFTSANGVRAFVRASPRRDVRVFAVGDATARAARKAGFEQTQRAGGDVDSLAQLVRQTLTPEAGPVLHIAGTVVAGDLVGRLGEHGFQVDRIALYEARRATTLSEAVLAAWTQGRIGAVLLYSPRTALILGDLVVAADLTERLRETEAVCLSQAVATAAQTAGATVLPWKALRVAALPQEEDMLALLDRRHA